LAVIAMSEFMQAYWYVFVIAIGVIFWAYKHMHAKSANFRKQVDKLALRLPIVGDIVTKSAIARYSRTLETMSAAGVPLVEAMESVAGATGNIIYADACHVIKDDISTGTQLQTSMKNSGLFPNMVIQMVSIGEEAGSLDFMLSKVADFYEAEVDNLVDSLTSLMEPIIMSVLGVLIGGLIVAMYLPIFQLGSVV
nr:type II secretion system F family protein [Gammaproteobacteria bacterium]